MEIPVYGLSGFGEITELDNYPELGKLKMFKKIAAAAKLQKQQQPGNGFKKVVSRMKNAALRKKITEKHVATLRGLEGIYNTAAAKMTTKEGVFCLDISIIFYLLKSAAKIHFF